MQHVVLNSVSCSGYQLQECARLLHRLKAAAEQAAAAAIHEGNATAATDSNTIALGHSMSSSFSPLPDWSRIQSDALSCGASLATQTSRQEGRALVVAQDAAAGATLWTEKPFAHLLLKQHRKQVHLHAGHNALLLSLDTCGATIVALQLAHSTGLAQALAHMYNTNSFSNAGRQVTETTIPSVQMRLCMLQKCSHCLKPLDVQACYSCPACPLVRYCTPSCRQGDTFHTPKGAECGLPWTLLLPADVVLAVRLSSKIAKVLKYPSLPSASERWHCLICDGLQHV